MSKTVILIGGMQGVGKGTQAQKLSQKYGFPIIEMGALLRNYAETDGSLYSKETMAAGFLAPQELVIKLLKENIENSPICILDGFPRNSAQASLFDILSLTLNFKVIRVLLEDEESVCRSRALSRGRADDTTKALNRRIKTYKSETLPTLMTYKGHLIDCRNKTPDEIFVDIDAIFVNEKA